MASGENRIPHPDFVTVSPQRSFVIAFDRKEHPHHLSALLIEHGSLIGGRKSGRRAA